MADSVVFFHKAFGQLESDSLLSTGENGLTIFLRVDLLKVYQFISLSVFVESVGSVRID
jgi:hypothetical protein